VALTVDDNTFHHKVLLIRGSVPVQFVDGIVPEYAAGGGTLLGKKQAGAWIQQVRATMPAMATITFVPVGLGLLDFQTRFPSALSARMAPDLFRLCTPHTAATGWR
jgi:hypothetical protein